LIIVTHHHQKRDLIQTEDLEETERHLILFEYLSSDDPVRVKQWSKVFKLTDNQNKLRAKYLN